jgi:hypothetical protein
MTLTPLTEMSVYSPQENNMTNTWRNRIDSFTVLAAALLITPFSAIAAPHGGTGGTGALSACGPYSAMVGIYGSAGTLIDKVGAVCVRVDRSAGTWEGAAYDAPAHGGTGGAPFRSVCPTGQAMAGFAGRAGSMVDNLQVICGPLGIREGKVAILSVQAPMGAVGQGTGGTAWQDMCPEGHHMTGVEVRTGTLVDEIRPIGCLQFAQVVAPLAPVTLSVSPPASNNLQLPPVCPYDVTWTAAAAGTGETKFQYMAHFVGQQIPYTMSVPITAKQWTKSLPAGNWKLSVNATRAGTTAVTTEIASYRINLPVTVTTSPASPAANTRVTIKANPMNACIPTDTTLKYNFQIFPPSGPASPVVQQDTDTWQTPPLAAGAYRVAVSIFIRKGASDVGMGGSPTYNFTVR